jgi:transcriptional regulator with XRE-family HTH domain
MLYQEIGRLIRKFRTAVNGSGISQEELAVAIGTNPNTVSRWETAVYKPTIDDLERLARFFKIPITYLLPESKSSPRLHALMSAVHDMEDQDLEEVIKYALFRRASVFRF